MTSFDRILLLPDVDHRYLYAGLAVVAAAVVGLFKKARAPGPCGGVGGGGGGGDAGAAPAPGLVKSVLLFCYACFLKPHQGDGGGSGTQQHALESFYRTQASVYDATRTLLLKGREDLLAMAAAQLVHRTRGQARRVWVDIGGGTGWNIEHMAAHVDVPTFFASVYLVDLSPSLCAVARQRFARLGWANVHVLCLDARAFRLADHAPGAGGADLVTLSYSLSMIPDYFSVVDALVPLLAPRGIIGAVDFYVQSAADVRFRGDSTGGLAGRPVGLLARTFWRAWFELDRVSLDPGRRDYLEHRFGTVLSANSRNTALGAIPYYVWLGTTAHAPGGSPRPAAAYQNHPWRAPYDGRLAKHTQFGDAYIYAFTWEDARADAALLQLRPGDVVLALTSAGDNILAYAAHRPARLHAVDLNPAQNHLLELKLAALAARLPYADYWRLFGDGHHPAFRALLVGRLSPHLSGRAFQFWLRHAAVFARPGGLYDSGGSRHALRLLRVVSRLFACRAAVRALLTAPSLAAQRALWRRRIRPALLSRLVAGLVVSQERFLWAALGVPRNQLAMIEADYVADQAAASSSSSSSALIPPQRSVRAHAVWRYMVNTLDPVADHVHLAADNPYYYVCLAGRFDRRCPPDYLTPEAHARLLGDGPDGPDGPSPLDALRIHTDEIQEVLARLPPATLTVAVVMDSMDWFDPPTPTTPLAACAATAQITRLNRAMQLGGRVLLRSSAQHPWYMAVFARLGFATKCHARRQPAAPARGAAVSPPAACIDRVNMYASCWVCTKVAHLPPPTPPTPATAAATADASSAIGGGGGGGGGRIDSLEL